MQENYPVIRGALLFAETTCSTALLYAFFDWRISGYFELRFANFFLFWVWNDKRSFSKAEKITRSTIAGIPRWFGENATLNWRIEGILMSLLVIILNFEWKWANESETFHVLTVERTTERNFQLTDLFENISLNTLQYIFLFRMKY